ncbi:MAG: cytochrome b/b6 domain-containing protein [Alphaproteobacteria bacterium]
MGHSTGTSNKHYHFISKAIHWITAILILWLLYIGYTMHAMDFSEDKLQLYALHKSLGLSVLALACVRVLWHIVKRKPAGLSTHAWWEKFLAHGVHVFLYIALFALPLSGWVMSSAGDFNVQFFGIDMPDIVAKNEALFKSSREAHEILAFLVLAVVAAHIAGALKHHFIDRDITLKRMISRRTGVISGIVLTLCIGGAYAFIMAAFVQALPSEKPTVTAEIQKPVIGAEETIPTVQEALFIEGVDQWVIDHENSQITFDATQYGQSFQGTLDFTGQIFFDPEKLEQSKVRIEVDIASIKTGSEDRDSQAKSDEWFDVSLFPKAIFSADVFERDGQNYIAKGTLTLRDVTANLDLPFSLNISGDENGQKNADMKANLILNRLDYGVGQGQWQSTDAIGADVQISIGLLASSSISAP